MTAGQIPVVKGILRKSSQAEAKELLDNAMQFSTAEEIERFIRNEMDKRFTETSDPGAAPISS
jgi:phosphotransferase system enzyme I (PtsI)